MTRDDLYWTRDGAEDLDSFLKARKPSMIKDDGSKPWIWVQKEPSEALADEDVKADTLATARAILASVTDKVKEIEADPNIPVRANKSKGTRSKKELREEAQANAAAELKKVSIESGETCGKWLLFRDGTKVDPTFGALARSLVHGPLSKTSARLMKVATCPHFDEEHYQHVICIYLRSSSRTSAQMIVYDEVAAKEILRVVAEEHGIELSSVKSDVYTLIGLDSKHESKMRSTIWQPKELGFDKDTMKATTEAYWEKQKSAKADDGDAQGADGGPVTSKRKAAGPTPEEIKATKKSTAKRAKATFADNDDSDSSDDDKKPVKSAVPPKRTAPPAQSSAKSKASKTFDGGDESSEDEADVKPTVKPASKSATSTEERASHNGAVEDKAKVKGEPKKVELSGSETEEE